MVMTLHGNRLTTMLILAAASVFVFVACDDGATPVQEPNKIPQEVERPKMNIDTNKTYTATLRTSKGDIVVQLDAGKAPITVNNFVSLARQGYYNDSTFHRVLPGFMAQGGDPTGTGAGGPGYTIQDEFTDLTHERGVISMANTGRPNTGGSQFFITFVATPHLDGRHAVFGNVTDGMAVLDSLTPRDPNQGPDFDGDKLLEVVIEEQ